jgi:hypothetical protein
MKILHFVFFLGLLGLFACQSNSTSAEEESPAELPPAPNNQVDAPEALASLFSPNSAVFRGVDFGKDLATVVADESAALLEQTDTEATFSIDFNEAEFSDFRYVTEEGKLVKMEVDIYASSNESAANYYNQLKEFFNAKYMVRTEGLWDGSENGVDFTTFLNLMEDDTAPGVLVIWEAE